MDVGAKREGALMHNLDDSVGGMTVFNKGLLRQRGWIVRKIIWVQSY